MKTLAAVFLAALFQAVAGSPLLAATILYDGFSASDYSPGQQIVDGVGGGTPPSAFAEGWDDRKNSAENADSIEAVGLTFTHPITQAQLAVSGHALLSRTQTLDSSENLRDLVDLALPENSELWFSLLLKKTGTSGQIDDAGFFQIFPLAGDGMAIGEFAFSDKISIVLAGDEARIAQTGKDVATGSVYFLVARIIARPAAADSIDLFIDPSPGVTPPLTADATLAGFDLSGVDAFQLSAFNQLAGAAYVFDEIRFGTTFADVALVIPEPSVGLLLTFGGIVFLALCRCSSDRSKLADDGFG